MEKSEKLQMVQKFSEKDFTQKFLIPLFQKMGFTNIKYNHGLLEYGKDIIYCEETKFRKLKYVGVQVKQGDIDTIIAEKIFSQIVKGLGPFIDLSDNNKEKIIDEFLVVTSGEIKEHAREGLSKLLENAHINKPLSFIEGGELIDLLDRYMPSVFWEEYDCFCKYFNEMKTDFEEINDFSAIGRQEPVPLENIYVSLRMIEPEIYIDWKIPSEKESESTKKKRKRLGEERSSKAKLIYLEKAIKDFDKLVITGVPGSGKTTLLKHIALKTCKENLEKQEKTCIPILIKLHEFSESEKNLREYIEEVFEKYQFPKAKDFIERDLKEGSCVLLLDGFDELAVKEKQDKVADQILKFVGKYHKNKIVVTSRVAGYHDELKGFTKLELMEFDDEQMKHFVQNWFGENQSEKAKSMLSTIKENEQIKALARNPLMISIIAVIYEEDRKLPQKRAALYNRCIEVLLSKWDVQKKLKNAYAPDKKEFILKKLAFYAHSNNKKILTEKEIMREMLKHFPRVQLKKEDAKPVLNEIWQRSYLLRQISRNSYDFLHLSFQEYFTALELKDRDDGITTIIKCLYESWWEEPILLYAGISNDATTLIKRVRQEVPEDIFYSNLLLFGKCIADADFTEPSLREEIIKDLWFLYQLSEFSFLRNTALKILALIKPEPDYIIEALIKNLKDKKKKNRISAASALGEIRSERAVEPLIEVLTNDKTFNVRPSAVRALGRIGSERAIDPLLKVLTTGKEANLQWYIAFALGQIRSEKAVEPLIEALTTAKDVDIRTSAADALGWIRSERAVEPLLDAFHNEKVRRRAANALGNIGSEKAVEPLIEALTTAKEADVRASAADALGEIGSEKAVKSLIRALTNDKRANVRASAASALGQIRGEKAVESLIDALIADKRITVRASAAYSLGELGSERAVEPLIEALATAKEADVRASAAFALGMIGSESAVEPLIEALNTDKDADVRGSAAYALKEIESEKAVAPLIKALTDAKEEDVRINAAYVLGGIGNEKTIEPLKIALKDDRYGFFGTMKETAFVSLEEICKRFKIRIPQQQEMILSK